MKNLKCCLCDYRGKAKQVGVCRTDGRSEPLFRCPSCKLDQVRGLFGQGQYVYGSWSETILDPGISRETSIRKLHCEKLFVERGLMPRDEMVSVSEEDLERLVLEEVASAVERSSDRDVAEIAETIRRGWSEGG